MTIVGLTSFCFDRCFLFINNDEHFHPCNILPFGPHKTNYAPTPWSAETIIYCYFVYFATNFVCCLNQSPLSVEKVLIPVQQASLGKSKPINSNRKSHGQCNVASHCQHFTSFSCLKFVARGMRQPQKLSTWILCLPNPPAAQRTLFVSYMQHNICFSDSEGFVVVWNILTHSSVASHTLVIKGQEERTLYCTKCWTVQKLHKQLSS